MRQGKGPEGGPQGADPKNRDLGWASSSEGGKEEKKKQMDLYIHKSEQMNNNYRQINTSQVTHENANMHSVTDT